MRGKFIDKIGEIHTTNQGFQFVILEYINSKNSTIKFCNGVILHNVRYDHIKDKSVSNPYFKSVLNVGFLGEGTNKVKVDGKINIIYRVWNDMLRRCYSEKHQQNNKTYIGCEVNEFWHNFQNFAEWHKENCKPYMNNSWELDKDILVKGNRIYSPKTCCFVPAEINGLFTKTNSKRGVYPIGVSLHTNGRFQAKLLKNKKQYYLGLFNTPEEAFEMYKAAKEKYIKEVSDKWKGLISDKVYEAMYKYEVEIND